MKDWQKTCLKTNEEHRITATDLKEGAKSEKRVFPTRQIHSTKANCKFATKNFRIAYPKELVSISERAG